MKNLIYPQLLFYFVCKKFLYELENVKLKNVKNDMQKYPKPPNFNSLKIKKSEINLYVLLTSDVKIHVICLTKEYGDFSPAKGLLRIALGMS